MPYAARTKVPQYRTRFEIEALVAKYGAENYAVFTSADGAMVAFSMRGRRILFRLPIPADASDQVRRALWRGLLLTIKAKLESIAAGIETFDDAFLAHIMMPGGQTVGEAVRPRIAQAYDGGEDVPLLPGPGEYDA